MHPTMKTMTSVVCAMVVLISTQVIAQQTIKTRVGDLSFTQDFANGYPTDATVDKLFNEMDFQRACQAYIWSIPIVSMTQWQYSHNEELGAENGQIVFVESYKDKLGGLTYNATTPYVLPFIDLTEDPWVIDVPEGEIRSAAHDMWQLEIAQIAKPGKHLFVGPSNKVPEGVEANGYTVHQSRTNNFLFVIRLMSKDRDVRMAMLDKVKIYPYSERDNPRPRGYVTPDGKPWMAAAPGGMKYWERLADIINREPVFERDRFFMAMLKQLGIEKSKPFKPNERQTAILTEAALVGEAMAKANDFSKSPRLEDAHYVDGSQWEFATTSPPDQRREHYDALDGRAAWLYEAVINDISMHGQKTGKGQIYMGTYKDKDGDWLDGGKNYVMHVPANAPAETFWSFTVYEVSTRTLISNEHEIADRSSRMDLLQNEDGSVTLYIGPDKPAGDKAKNWIPTEPGRAWFPYFRLYSPKKAFLDRTWILPDIEKAK